MSFQINVGENGVVKRKHHTWSAEKLVEVFGAAAAKSNSSHVFIVSDDSALVQEVLSLESKLEGRLRFITNSAMNHASKGQDCVREPSVGCDSTVSRSVIAESIVFDFLLGASAAHMIGSFRSSFSAAMISLLVPWVLSSSPLGVWPSGRTFPIVVNLDQMLPGGSSQELAIEDLI